MDCCPCRGLGELKHTARSFPRLSPPTPRVSVGKAGSGGSVVGYSPGMCARPRRPSVLVGRGAHTRRARRATGLEVRGGGRRE